MTAVADSTRMSDALRLRYWFIAYCVLWVSGLVLMFTSSNPDLAPGIYVFVAAIIPYVVSIVYAYKVQRALNAAGLYKPGAWQIIVGALLFNPLFVGILIPASVLWTNYRIERRLRTPPPPN